MKGYVKLFVLVIVAAVAVATGVYVYYLTLPRTSLLVYPDSRITGCKTRLNETVILHVKNDGNIDLYINATVIESYGGINFSVYITYMFQSDIVIPVGVEALIIFPAGGGEVLVETISGPPGAVAGGGAYAISDNPEPNPFGMWRKAELTTHTRAGRMGGGVAVAIMLEE